MRCNYDDPDLDLRCLQDAEWNNRCPRHGGRHPTVPELMTLLAELTRWGDQSLEVRIGYKRARSWDESGESTLSNDKRGFVASVKPISLPDVSAQGETLEQALWALCEEVVQQAEGDQRRAYDVAFAARNELTRFTIGRATS